MKNSILKKLVSVIILLVTASYSCFANGAAPAIWIDSSRGYFYVQVYGELPIELAGESVTLLLIKSGANADNPEYSDIGYINQSTVNQNGSYAFKFKFKGFKYNSNGDISEYNIVVNQGGKNVTDSITTADVKIADADLTHICSAKSLNGRLERTAYTGYHVRSEYSDSNNYLKLNLYGAAYKSGEKKLNNIDRRKITVSNENLHGGLLSSETGDLSITGEQSYRSFLWTDDLGPVASTKSINNKQESETVLYVSRDGDDSNAGTKEAPFATLVKARDTIRQMKKDGVLSKRSVVVYIRGGVYEMNKKFDLRAADSGTENCRIVYRAYPGEEVVFSGGQSLNAEDFLPVTDSNVLSKVTDAGARANLVEYDLSKLGYSGNFPKQNYRGTYNVFRPEFNYPLPSDDPVMSMSYKTPPELFVDGSAMVVARYPNEGTMKVKEVFNVGQKLSNWIDSKKGTSDYIAPEDRNPNDTFVFNSEDNRYLGWKNAKNAYLCGFWFYNWADQSVPFDIDMQQQRIKSLQPSVYGIRSGQGFYVYNLLEEIDMRGEYYIDVDANKIYMYPPNKMNDVSFSKMTAALIGVYGAKYIDIKGIKFRYSRSTFIEIDNSCSNIKVSNCEFSFGSSGAVFLSGKNNGVENCYIHDTGGVYISAGKSNTLTKANCYVENCEFERFSQIKQTYAPAITIEGCGNRASHNEIHDAPHVAIMFSGCYQTIDYNNIYDVCKSTDDAGAIYAGKNPTYRGNVVNYNYFHDIQSSASGSEGVAAIYMDDMFCGLTAKRNVFENIQGKAFFLGGGRDNVMEENTFINVKRPLSLGSRLKTLSALDPKTGWFGAALEAVPYRSDEWKKAFPKLYSIMLNDPYRPNGNIFRDNFLADCGKNTVSADASEFSDENNIYTSSTDANYRKTIDKFAFVPRNVMGRLSNYSDTVIGDSILMCVDSPLVYKSNMLECLDKSSDAAPYTDNNGVIYAPLNSVCKLKDMEPIEEQGNAIITAFDGSKISVDCVNGTIYKDNEKVNLSSAPRLTDGVIYIPIDVFAVIFGQEISWTDKGLISIGGIASMKDWFTDGADFEYLFEKVCAK